MALTRIIETNWAHRQVNELDLYAGPGNHNGSHTGVGSISATRVRVNGFSFLSGGTTAPRGKYCSARSQVEGGFFVNHDGLVNAASIATIVLIPVGANYSSVQWDSATGTFKMFVLGVQVGTVAVGAFTTTNKWYHIGYTYKAAAAGGFFSFYIDGVQKLTFAGNTGASNIGGAFFAGGPSLVATSFANAYWGCFYLYDATGEVDDAPPAHEFPFLPVASAGFYNGNWIPNGAATNVLAVDEYPSDGDTTYSEGNTLNLTESFVLQTPGVGFLPSGYTITGVIPSTYSRRTDAILTTLTLGVRESGGSEQYGATAQDLSIGYTEVNDMFLQKSGPANWALADLTGLQIIIKATGAF